MERASRYLGTHWKYEKPCTWRQVIAGSRVYELHSGSLADSPWFPDRGAEDVDDEMEPNKKIDVVLSSRRFS